MTAATGSRISGPAEKPNVAHRYFDALFRILVPTNRPSVRNRHPMLEPRQYNACVGCAGAATHPDRRGSVRQPLARRTLRADVASAAAQSPRHAWMPASLRCSRDAGIAVRSGDRDAYGHTRDNGSNDQVRPPWPNAGVSNGTLSGYTGNGGAHRRRGNAESDSCTQSAGLEKQCFFYKARPRASSNVLEYNPYPRHPLRCSLVVCYILEPTFIDPGDLSAVSVCMTALVAVSLKMPSWSPHEPKVQGRRPQRQMRGVPPFPSLVTTCRALH